jgi:hypothetical protein
MSTKATEVMNDKFWEDFGELKSLKSSNNEILPYSGVGFIYGLPASRKTTIAINTVKSMKEFSQYLYIDMDSKTPQQAKDAYSSLSKIEWKYYNNMLQGGNANNVISLLKDIKKDSVVIIDTWHQLVSGESENDNDYAKKVMKILRTLALKKNLLIVLIAHSGKTNNDIRGASSVSGDATFKVLVSMDKEICTIEITKDSTGMLSSCTAIITKSSSITETVIEYSNELVKKEVVMKPKELAVTETMLKRVNSLMNDNKIVNIGELRDWLYDNYNSINSFKPSDPLFCANRFLKDNFSDFTESLFIIEKQGRSKFITGFIYDEHREES